MRRRSHCRGHAATSLDRTEQHQRAMLARVGELIWLTCTGEIFLVALSELACWQSKLLARCQTPVLAQEGETVPSK